MVSPASLLHAAPAGLFSWALWRPLIDILSEVFVRNWYLWPAPLVASYYSRKIERGTDEGITTLENRD